MDRGDHIDDRLKRFEDFFGITYFLMLNYCIHRRKNVKTPTRSFSMRSTGCGERRKGALTLIRSGEE